MKSHRQAGNHNLKGKEYKLLSCRCCAIINLKGKVDKRRIALEIKEQMDG